MATFINKEYESFLGVGMCDTHLPAPQLEGCSYNELDPNCRFGDTQIKENVFYYFYMLFVSNFLIRNLFFICCLYDRASPI